VSSRISSRLDKLVTWGRENVNPDARKHLQRAMHGDAAALRNLILNLSGSERAALTVKLFREKAPLGVYRPILRQTWLTWWISLIREAGGLLEVVELFEYASFEIPKQIGPTVKVYRGGRGITAEQCALGLSWSLNRDVACYFAHGNGHDFSEGAPIVIEATVPASKF
jgi:hypothetical protein